VKTKLFSIKFYKATKTQFLFHFFDELKLIYN